MIKTFIFAAIAFALPVAAVTWSNWENVRPYVIGDPATAEGELYYFAASG